MNTARKLDEARTFSTTPISKSAARPEGALLDAVDFFTRKHSESRRTRLFRRLKSFFGWQLSRFRRREEIV